MKSRLLHLSNEFIHAIAYVSVRSAELDHTIEITIVELLHPNRKSAEKILKNWNQSRQVELVGTLLEDRFPWYATEVQNFIAKIEAARSERNIIMHYLWGAADVDGAAKLASRRPFRAPKEITKTADEVGAVADAMLDITNKLYELLYYLREQRIASPDERAPLPPRGNYPWPLNPDLPDKPSTTRARS